MNRSLRTLILLVGVLSTYVYAAVPGVPAPDGNPRPTRGTGVVVSLQR